MIAHSNELDKIAAALSAFQSQMAGVSKSGINPHLKNKYASLEDCWTAIREPLAANQLAVTQLGSIVDDREVLVTTIWHASGQYISGYHPLSDAAGTKSMNADQAHGSALTYLRRYALSAALGLTPADDDAASAGPPPARTNGRAHPVKKQNTAEDEQAAFIRMCNDLQAPDAALYALYKQYEVDGLDNVPADKRRSFFNDLKTEIVAQKAGV